MGFERPAFGRRRSINAKELAERQAIKSEAPQRVFPDEVWDTEAGDTLRENGIHPESEINQRPTQESANARFEEEYAKQRAYVEHVNAQLPQGAKVAPYAMLPWELWNGRFGEMLAMRCALWAPGAWNQMLLAEDEHSSAILGLPVHPGAYPDGLMEEIERLLEEAHAPIAGLIEKTQVEQSVSWDQINACDEAYQDLMRKVIMMSHYLGSMCIGEEAWARHTEVFGTNVGWY